MEERLVVASRTGDIDALYALLEEDPELLEKIDRKPLVNTPLHEAAAAGCTHFAIEVLSLMPSFGRKLTPSGRSVLELALRNGHIKTVQQLVRCNPELVLVKGRGRFTPMHYAAEMDETDLLAMFLLACPQSIEDLTIRGETAMHIAVRCGNIRALKVLLGWLQRTNNQDLLNWEDEDGNTLLHIASITNQSEMVSLLLRKIKSDVRNSEGLTALDVAMKLPNEESRRIHELLGHKRASKPCKVLKISEFLNKPEKMYEKMVRFRASVEIGLSMEIRNALLVVAVLISAGTFQALLQPPGGVSQGINYTPSSSTDYISDRPIGKSVMSITTFHLFVIFNVVQCASTFAAVLMLLPLDSLLVFLTLPSIFSYTIVVSVISPDNIVVGYVIAILVTTYVLVVAFKVLLSWNIKAAKRWSIGSNTFYCSREVILSIILKRYS